MTAAGGPPSRTIARTRARKLPDTLSFDVVVSAAVRSLMTAQARSARASGMFQSADPDVSAARIAAALSAASWTHCLEGLGCRITWVLRRTLNVSATRLGGLRRSVRCSKRARLRARPCQSLRGGTNRDGSPWLLLSQVEAASVTRAGRAQ